jgi:ornithine cyclodeaminase/alanine dehydrogenase-like protein (mu-crystallin family)
MSAQPRLISAEAVWQAADLPALIASLQTALTEGERSRCQVPTRTLILQDRPFAAYGAMPALGRRLFITKVAAFVDRAAAPGEAVHALVNAFDRSTGQPLAVIEGGALTKLKSAAVAGVVAERCATQHVRVLAVLGSGAQAEAQLLGIGAVRTPEEVRVYSRHPANVARLLDRLPDLLTRSVRGVAAHSAAEAAQSADVLVTATTSRTPLLESFELPAHAHVHCVGAHTPESRELSTSTLARARLVVEDVASAVREAGALHRDALDLEAMLRVPAAELECAFTVFSSVGHAFLDLFATAHVLIRAGVLESEVGP